MNDSTVFETIGNVELLSQKKVALFASKSAPQTIYEEALNLFSELCSLPVTLAGGWQAPLERWLFKKIPGSVQANFIYYLARDINYFKPTDLQDELIRQNKLLVIAPVLNQKRGSKAAVNKRDDLLFAQISKILYLYIEKNGRLEQYFRQLSHSDYQFFFLDHPLNSLFKGEDIVKLNGENAGDLILI